MTAQAGTKRRREAQGMRDRGLTFAQIGVRLGVSRQRAFQIVTGAEYPQARAPRLVAVKDEAKARAGRASAAARAARRASPA